MRTALLSATTRACHFRMAKSDFDIARRLWLAWYSAPRTSNEILARRPQRVRHSCREVQDVFSSATCYAVFCQVAGHSRRSGLPTISSPLKKHAAIRCPVRRRLACLASFQTCACCRTAVGRGLFGGAGSGSSRGYPGRRGHRPATANSPHACNGRLRNVRKTGMAERSTA